MAVRTIVELKSLWVNGFIPNQDDYVDLFDTIESLSLNQSGGSFDSLRFIDGVANNLSDIDSLISGYTSNSYFLVRTLNGSVYFCCRKGPASISRLDKCRISIIRNDGVLKNNPISLNETANSNDLDVWNFPITGIGASYVDGDLYGFDFWRVQPEGISTLITTDGGAQTITVVDGDITSVDSST